MCKCTPEIKTPFCGKAGCRPPVQCEGWRRHGGAFSLGPVSWVQCENEATVNITVTQDGKTEEMPACPICWQECIDNKIDIGSVMPIIVPELDVWGR